MGAGSKMPGYFCASPKLKLSNYSQGVFAVPFPERASAAIEPGMSASGEDISRFMMAHLDDGALGAAMQGSTEPSHAC